MTSKIKKTSNYDNDPNSVFGASKRVIQEYRKTLDSGKEAPTPFKQGEKSQAKSDVVNNLNEFTSLIKTITLGLNNVDTYISSKANEDMEGSGMYRYRGGVIFKNANEARDYLINKYGNQKIGTKFSDEDREIVKKYKLVDTMRLGAIKKADRILGLIDQQSMRDRGQTYLFAEEPRGKKETPATLGQAEFENDIKDLEFSNMIGNNSLNARAENEPRFSQKTQHIDITGGDPDQDPEQAKEQESVFRRWKAPVEDEGDESPSDEDEGFSAQMMGDDNEAMETYANTPPDSESDEPDIDPETDIEDVIRKGQKAPTENYLITLVSTVINQINKAQDIWEQEISPNITSIPKIKMDSFVNSKTIKEFEDIIAKLENNATTLTVKYYYNFLDKVFTRLISSLDEIFNVINLDIKKYSSGVYISGGFVPINSRYNPFVNASTTKYLM
jgi:hypothetical protein